MRIEGITKIKEELKSLEQNLISTDNRLLFDIELDSKYVNKITRAIGSCVVELIDIEQELYDEEKEVENER